jgi:hypothetical protein
MFGALERPEDVVGVLYHPQAVLAQFGYKQ